MTTRTERTVIATQNSDAVYGPSRAEVLIAKPLKKFGEHGKPISCMCTQRNVLATAGEDGYVQLWQLPSLKQIGAIAVRSSPTVPPSSVSCIKLTPEADLVVTGSADGIARAWSVQSGACIRCYRITQTVTAVQRRSPVTSVCIKDKWLITYVASSS